MSREMTARTVAAMPGARSRTTRRALAVAGFAVLTAVGARLSVPLAPVPFTFQVVAVLAAGLLLGPKLGAASQLTYLAAGAAGLPVFAAGGGLTYLLGPTGGYLLAYPVAALVVGLLAHRRGFLRQGVGLLAGQAVIYAGGVAWMTPALGPGRAMAVGLAPFLVVDLLKVVLVWLAGRRLEGPLSHFLA